MKYGSLLRFPSRPDWYVATLPRQAGGGFIVAVAAFRLLLPRAGLLLLALLLLALYEVIAGS